MKASIFVSLFACVSFALTACGGGESSQTTNAVVASSAADENIVTAANKEIARNFCYAIHAIGNCSGLNMRLDTEAKIDKLVGTNIREKGSVFEDDCLDGLIQANEDKNLCSNAWDRFGCNGKIMPKLLFKKDDFCVFGDS
ncbi:hypothetical protein [Stenoxybacter acetivorans]|uniref:hypothetical protein n=1 Tax=Stenoxybacter acetivorans TaxID=422441 RepID=UPI00055D77CC|nr:hypothetical protein [Stenoxybacter acetivorans]